MLGYIAHAIANPAARLWLATSAQSWHNLPVPSDAPLVHAPGSDSDRVMLLGSGIAVGYGVMSHDLGLGGHIARELSARTSRGASVDIVGRRDMAPTNTRALLGSLDLGRFDAVVLVLGGLEALTLMPPAMWRRQMRALFLELEAIAPSSLKLFVVEIGAPLLNGLPLGVRTAVWKHLGRLNRVTEELCREFDAATFVAFAPPQGDLTLVTGRTTYQGWAELIAPPVARALDAEARRRRPTAPDEESRQRAVDLLDVDSVPSDELDRIVANARDLFGTTGASVTIIDRDLQRTKSAAGIPAGTIPRSDSICNLTIEESGVLVVEDMTTDPRLAGSPWADGAHARFYAGYPVEAPDGHRIGALCIVDRSPRTFSDTDAALLRQLALRVQSALWGASATR